MKSLEIFVLTKQKKQKPKAFGILSFCQSFCTLAFEVPMAAAFVEYVCVWRRGEA